MNSAALKQLKENSSWYLVLGISLIILGTLFIFYSFTATIVSVIYLGALITIAGIFEGVKAFKMNKWKSFFLHLFLCILYLIAGIFIALNPAVNALTLTLLLAIFFVITGIAKTIFALTQHVPHKMWILLNGILTLILGILIWMQWPVSGLWVIGMFFGIDLIFTGFTWIQLSMIAKNLK